MELETLLERLHLDSKCNYKERIEKLKRKTFYHITNWKEKKRLQKQRKRLVRYLKKKMNQLNYNI